nr:RDD family protein [Nocardioides flavescens]
MAGWWQRVGAYVIDAVLLGVVSTLLTLPWWREVVDVYRDWFDDVVRAAEAGRESTVDAGSLQRQIAGPLAIITAISLAVSFLYQVGFLMWRQATPGKLALGLRVRLRERPGRMGFGTVALRWLAQFGVGIVNLVPLVGTLVGLYSILDLLWPLWDSKKQAIHDKVAKTNVVRTR